MLMLSTVHPGHASRSGYNQLAQYVPGAEYLHTVRKDPDGALPRFAVRVARRTVSFSRWYLGGCARLEWQAFQRLRREGFAGVVHSMWADHDLGFLDLLLDRKRHRLCGTFHNCPNTFRETIRFPSRLRRFDAIVLMSETQRPFFVAAGVDPRRIHVVLHGVDTGYFVPKKVAAAKREHGEDDRFTVLSGGGYRRNFPLLRKVCEQLLADSRVRFEIIGPEAFRRLFEGLANAQFCSGISDEEFLRRYQSAACLLHVAENATANNMLIEAMACGLPIVSERLGGIPEYVNANCATLVEPGDGASLAGAISALADSPNLLAGMSSAARARAEELDWSRVAGKMAAIFRDLESEFA